jgi:acylphosphatase
MEKAAVKALVSGMVQGVGYRYFAAREASPFEITGYVKNLPDGRVEVFAEGQREELDQFLEKLRRGPRFGFVEHVEIEWLDYQGRFKKFSIDTGY